MIIFVTSLNFAKHFWENSQELCRAPLSLLCLKQFGSHWMNTAWQFMLDLLKSVNKIQLSLKSDKNCGHFTQRPKCIFWEYHTISSTPLMRAHWGCHESKVMSSHLLISQMKYNTLSILHCMNILYYVSFSIRRPGT
jgi:hypothetical protein